MKDRKGRMYEIRVLPLNEKPTLSLTRHSWTTVLCSRNIIHRTVQQECGRLRQDVKER